MAVLMANRSLAVRRRTGVVYDASGYPLPAGLGGLSEARPGRYEERTDHSWSIALDPGLWPVGEGDVVVEPGTGDEWLVATADLLRNNLDPAVDYIRVEAEQRVPGGTRPPGTTLDGP